VKSIHTKLRHLNLLCIFKFIVLITLAVIAIYPLIYTFLAAFKTLEEFQTLPPYYLPQSLYWNNFIEVVTKSNLPLYFGNSLIITLAVDLGVVILATMASFAIEKLDFRYNQHILIYFLLGLMIPIQCCLLPLYLMFSGIHLTNTYSGVIIPQIAFGLPLSIFLCTKFYKFLPNEIIEASVIDGCTARQLFFKIVVPMSQNIILTLTLLRTVFCWNDFIFPYTFTNSKRLQTVTLGIQDFIGAYGYTDWGKTFATVSLTIIPTLLLYFFLGKYMVAGMSEGSIKG
jgi:raffinose/stachyose/melibiose transport system permease protein